jgi:hypothetical protein
MCGYEKTTETSAKENAMRLLTKPGILSFGIILIGISWTAEQVNAFDEVSSAPIALQTSADRLLFDKDTGRLISLRSKSNPDVELLAGLPTDPVFALDYLGEDRQYRQIDSRSAAKVSAVLSETGQEQKLTFVFSRLAGLDVDVTG